MTEPGPLDDKFDQADAPPAETKADPAIVSRPAFDGAEDGGEYRFPPKLPQTPVTKREIICVLALVALCDVTIYRGHGYAGLAALMAGAPLLAWCGSAERRPRRSIWPVALLLLLVAVRLVWCGSTLAAVAGFGLLTAFLACLSGLSPFVLRTFVFGASLIVEGHSALEDYSASWSQMKPPARESRRANWLATLLPATAICVFSAFFVLANPDLLSFMSGHLAELVRQLQAKLQAIMPAPTEVLFWMPALWLSAAALRPLSIRREESAPEDERLPPSDQSAEASLYEAFRNTLVALIGLFVVYLVFEFATLWFREFPKGFHYSGYAHEGAAWLTVALATATLLLSIIFRGSILGDPRVPSLKRLAWLWSFENLLLAISVYHRLGIYVGFNGLTRMRMVGVLGISSVVVGFALVVWMIANRRNFRWLLRRQLWTVAFAAYLYAVMPIDMLVNRYNVSRILAGDHAPCVQISVHDTTAEGLLELWPLADSSDQTIRNGVRAVLAEAYVEDVRTRFMRGSSDWTAFQIADRLLVDQLFSVAATWPEWNNSPDRLASRARFDEWAYQWY